MHITLMFDTYRLRFRPNLKRWKDSNGWVIGLVWLGFSFWFGNWRYHRLPLTGWDVSIDNCTWAVDAKVLIDKDGPHA